jgi:hypothetical protein
MDDSPQPSQLRVTHNWTFDKRQLAAAEREIDRLVYELYGLSDDEIKIVEEATR